MTWLRVGGSSAFGDTEKSGVRWNHFELREYDPIIGRWASTDPYGQYWSPYNGMGNDPVNYADPNGAYTKFGAWWRNGFSMEGVHQDGGEWGFLTTSDDGGFVPHYGDENIWRPENGQRILDRAWENTGLAYGQMSTYDRIMARGGDGIEPFNIEFEVALAITTGGIGNAAKAGLSATARARSLGMAGETAVGITAPKTAIQVAGRTRFPDRLTRYTLEEVKNVSHQSFTRQLRDFHRFSQDNGLQMILHTRSNTTFSGPLRQMIDNGQIVRQIIPGH